MFGGLHGKGGQVSVAGRVAATLTDWSMRLDPATREYVISAGLADVVAPYLSPQYRMEVRLQMTKRFWRWRNAAIEVDGTRMVARVTGEADVL